MRVLFVVHRMHPNLFEVYHALKSSGNECVFVVDKIGPSEPPLFSDRILFSELQTSRAVNEILDTYQPNLIIQRNTSGPFLRFWKIAGERRIPRVLYTQDPHTLPLLDVLFRPLRVVRLVRDLFVQRIVLGRHKRITPVMSWGQKSRFAFRHSEYVPLPMRTQITRREGKLTDLISVITVAKHGQKRKRVNWLLRALANRTKRFELTIVGSSPDPKDQNRIREAHRTQVRIERTQDLSRYVKVLTDLNRDELENEYHKSHLYVLASRRDPMAISPLEAMSRGIPVLVSADGGAASYVQNVGKEQIFRARSYRDFERKLFNLLEDEKLRLKLGKRAVEYVRQHHAPATFVSKLYNLAFGHKG